MQFILTVISWYLYFVRQAGNVIKSGELQVVSAPEDAICMRILKDVGISAFEENGAEASNDVFREDVVFLDWHVYYAFDTELYLDVS